MAWPIKAAAALLAVRHPFLDIGRVALRGHAGVAFISAAAMLVYPEFLKNAVSRAQPIENNIHRTGK